MDGFQTFRPATAAATAIDAESAAPSRSFLFLQGPISNFFDRLAGALTARGHRVLRVNLHFGDRLFWHSPAIDYRGSFADWRGFVAGLMERHGITDVVLHGDRRPYHLVAAEEARARGIAVLATDLGYVRPDWITLEYDGLTTYSRFPRDPDAIRALAAEFPEPDLAQRFQTPFWMIAWRDIAYNLGLVFGRPFFPKYRYHSVSHPFAEYAGWVISRPRKLLAAGATAMAKRRLEQEPGTYFLVPLQLQTDYQLRAHSPFDDLRHAVRAIVESFAASGSRRKLVFIVHPLDNGLIDWHRLIARLARERGVDHLVLPLHGGTPTGLLRNAAGVVTINSTVGLAALYFGVPVKALGNAIFDVAGLTSQAPLDRFWHEPAPPDPELLAAFLRALVGSTQVKGGYYERRSQDGAIAGFIERLEGRPYPLPPPTAAEWSKRAPRRAARSIAIVGASSTAGAALARAMAAPGVQLYLVGGSAAALAGPAADCRQRGALVETIDHGDRRPPSLAAQPSLAAIDAVDVVIAHSPPADSDASDVLAAMDAVAAFAEPMRRRGRGEIVLISGAAGRVLPEPPPTRRSQANWRFYASALQRRVRGDGIAVTLVQSSRAALTLAVWLRDPLLSAASPDRFAEAVLDGLRRGRRRVAIPVLPNVVTRAFRLLPRRGRQAIGETLLSGPDDLAAPLEHVPLVRETASGD